MLLVLTFPRAVGMFRFGLPTLFAYKKDFSSFKFVEKLENLMGEKLNAITQATRVQYFQDQMIT